MPTYDAFNNFVCSTGNGSSDLIDFTATITTRASTVSAGDADPEGIFYTLWTYYCVEGFQPGLAPTGNANDGAIQYCTSGPGVCGVSVVNTVQFLTETSSSHESKSVAPTSEPSAPTSQSAAEAAPAAAPSSQAAPTVQADPTIPATLSSTPAESTTEQKTTAVASPPAPQSNPAPDSSSEAVLTTLVDPLPPSTSPTTSPTAIAPVVPAEPSQGETSPIPALSTTQEETSEPQTHLLTLELEVTGPGPTTTETVPAVTLVITEQVTITKENAVYVVIPEATRAEPVSSSEVVGDAIASGLGLNQSSVTSTQSSGSGSATSAQQFPGVAPSASVPMCLLAFSIAIAMVSLA